MQQQDVIAFDTDRLREEQERGDEAALVSVFERQQVLADGIDGGAMLLYRLRAIWIGGMCLPWGLLTEGQRKGYRAEFEALVKKAKGE
jgi:hypothetical protein